MAEGGLNEARKEGRSQTDWTFNDPLRMRRELRLCLLLPRPARSIDPQATVSTKTFQDHQILSLHRIGCR